MESYLQLTTSNNCVMGSLVRSEYWDTCLFIAYLQNKPEEGGLVDVISTLLRRAEIGNTLIVVSTLVLAEIRPLRAYDPRHSDVLWDLFHTNRPYLKFVALSPRIAELAGTIGSEHRITSPDAVHVATAWSERVDVMLTIDGGPNNETRRSGGLLSFDGKIGRPPLKIEYPVMPIDSQLALPKSDC